MEKKKKKPSWSSLADLGESVHALCFGMKGWQRKEELGEKRKHRWLPELPQERKADCC